MKVLSAQESAAWLKKRNLKKPTESAETKRTDALLPDRSRYVELATRLSQLTDWSEGAVILAPSIPWRPAVLELCKLRESFGFPTTPKDIEGTVAPGHLLATERAQSELEAFQALRLAMLGNFDATAATRNGRFALVLYDCVLSFYTRDKATPGKLRALIRELDLRLLDHR